MMLRSLTRSTLGFSITVLALSLLASLFVPGTAVAQSISGYVLLDTGDVTQVALTLSGAATGVYYPNAPDGDYVIPGLTFGESYTVTPILDDYIFEPAFIPYDPLTTDMFAQNYQGTYSPIAPVEGGFALDLLAEPSFI